MRTSPGVKRSLLDSFIPTALTMELGILMGCFSYRGGRKNNHDMEGGSGMGTVRAGIGRHHLHRRRHLMEPSPTPDLTVIQPGRLVVAVAIAAFSASPHISPHADRGFMQFELIFIWGNGEMENPHLNT